MEVLKYLRKLKKSAHIVRNHDLHFLNCYFNNILPKNNDTLIPLLRDKSEITCRIPLETTLFFSKQVFIKNNFKNVGMVHAGIPETMSLKESEIMSRKMTQKLVSNPKNLKKILKNFQQVAEDDIFEKSKFFTTVRSVDALENLIILIKI